MRKQQTATDFSRDTPWFYRRVAAMLPALATGVALLAGPAAAQDRWPSKPVSIVSPYNPGGTNDVVARIMADRLQKALGQSFVVENKAGAAGIVGTLGVVRSKPDGYTLLSGNNGVLVIQVAGRETAPFDPLRQLTPIIKVADAGQFIGISSDIPARTVGELIAHMKKEPGKLNFSSSGTGSFGHFLGEYLKLVAGVDMLHVPAKGSAAALTEMMAHRINVMIDPLILTQITDNRIRVLATLNGQRSEAYPQIPTMKEAGGPDLRLDGWFGLAGPAGLPQDIIDRIAAVGRAIPNDADARKAFGTSGLIAAPLADKQFAELIRSDLQKVTDIRVRAKITID